MSKYAKFFVALSGVLIAVGNALTDGAIQQSDLFDILAAVGVAYGVYRVPNRDPQAVDPVKAYDDGFRMGTNVAAMAFAAVPSQTAVVLEPEPPTTADGHPKREWAGA